MNDQIEKAQDREEADRHPYLSDLIKIKEQFYILATSSMADERSRVLKQGETFGVFDHYGDIKPVGMGEEGLYHEGTRYLSCLVLRLGGKRPLFLSSTVKEDNALMAVDLTNTDVSIGDQVIVPRGTLHISRMKYLWQGVCHERLRIKNYGLVPVTADISLYIEADFADIFEVRGVKREKRGQTLSEAESSNSLVFSYLGLDGETRRTRIEFQPDPTIILRSEVQYSVTLHPQEERTVQLRVACEPHRPGLAYQSYQDALGAAEQELATERSRACDIYTSNEQFNDWLNRSLADLVMMTTKTPEGPYPYAGVPWFSTVFGRDGIITALEYLWVDPSLARGVLGHLAATQAREVDPARDAEPGKILHEARKGEMAALGEIPFGRYYGSVDSTPLFVMLAGAYYERTGDRELIASIWPHIELALHWIDTYGDSDGDGFVEYLKRSPKGLVQQGWKDSQDSVFHADGTLADGPIALCEVQGYVYAARRRAARLATVLGKTELAAKLSSQAHTLQQKFEQAFWCEDIGTYALALDGQKRPCCVRASNAGHCLWAGIAEPERARRVAETLLSEDSFSGWGVRTVSAGEARYNPMSYHNGSVWPHDNALIAHGLARYGMENQALKVLTGLFDASLFVDLFRMPELFCGFIRRPGEGPTLYPVACAPQSWAAASVFMLLQACLGLRIDNEGPQVTFFHPCLPPSLQEIRIRNLKVGQATIDLYLERHEHDVGVNVLRREGQVNVILVK